MPTHVMAEPGTSGSVPGSNTHRPRFAGRRGYFPLPTSAGLRAGCRSDDLLMRQQTNRIEHWRRGAATVAAGLTLALAWALPGSARAVKGQPAPALSGPTLEGGRVSLSEFQGKNPVVLGFYAAFGPSSRESLAHLKELDEKHGGRGLRVIAVSMDEDRKTAAAIPNQLKVRFPVVLDPRSEVSDRYGVQALPHTVVVHRDGKVHAVIVGPKTSAVDRAVEELLR